MMEGFATKRRRELVLYSSTPRKTSCSKFSNLETEDILEVKNMIPDFDQPQHKRFKSNFVGINCSSNRKLDDFQASDRCVNPFEVLRTDNFSNQGLNNPALNISIEGEPEAHVSLFEVFRKKPSSSSKGMEGVVNYGLESTYPDCKPFLLALPFTPTVNHRVHFVENYSIANYDKILPKKTESECDDTNDYLTLKSKKEDEDEPVLSTINEELEIDIKQELDNYQLELENSMNEAKIRKLEIDTNPIDTSSIRSKIELIDDQGLETEHKKIEVEIKLFDSDNDVQFEEIDSFEELGVFKRAYRREAPSDVIKKNVKAKNIMEKEKITIGTIVRNSMRKFIKPKSSKSVNQKTKSYETKENEGLLRTIRRSLRVRSHTSVKTQQTDFMEQTILSHERPVFKELSSKTIVTEKITTECLSIEDQNRPFPSSKSSKNIDLTKKHSIKTKNTFKDIVNIFDSL